MGKTLGVIGFGRAGREVARRARVFGMRIIASDPLVPAASFEAEGVPPVPLDTIFAESDFITLHVPFEPSTRSLINADALARCRRGVRILNTARGGVVDEAALLAALEIGHVAGAGLDVFEKEPTPPDHPLLRHPRVVATPHLGASTAEAQERVAEEVGREVASFLLKGVAANIVNREALRG
jgi:D-3-phosphoglycerate dehydrogenase